MTNLIRNLRTGRASALAIAAVLTWATGGLVACSDTTGVPARTVSSPSSLAPAPSPQRGSLGASLISQTTVGDTTVSVFVVDNSGRRTLFRIGNESYIFFPSGAASICDPATSGYGVGTWDTPCQPIKGNIKITAKSWVNPATGGVSTDFSPELRFVPAAPMGVTLFLHDMSPSTTERIDYCSDGVCVDDALVDGALITNRDGSGFVYRVIKHFSGYNVVVN